MIDAEAVFAAVSPAEAVERTRIAFERHHAGEWVMPAKTYVDAPPARRLPGDAGARRGPRDPQVGHVVPRQPGARAAGRRRRAARLERRDRRAARDRSTARAVTSLRTGAAAAVSAQALARDDARDGRPDRLRRQRRRGRRAAWPRSATRTASAPTPAPRAPRRWRASSAGATGSREEAAAQDVVVTVTPGDEPVILASDLRPGQHLAVLGADAHGKAEVELAAIERCELFCDEWEQASKGGELSNGVSAGIVERDGVDGARRGPGGRGRRPTSRTRSRSSTRPASRSRTSESPWRSSG